MAASKRLFLLGLIGIFLLCSLSVAVAVAASYDPLITFKDGQEISVNNGVTTTKIPAFRSGVQGNLLAGAKITIMIENGSMVPRVQCGTFVTNSGKTYSIVNGKETIGKAKTVKPKTVKKTAAKKTASKTIAKPNLSTVDRALILAVINNQISEVKRLLKAGANPNAANGNSVLENAAGLGRLECVRLLLDAGADPNKKGYLTPLMQASLHGNGEIVKMLMDAGANPFIKDSKGRTAFDLAYGNQDILALLNSKTMQTLSSPSAGSSPTSTTSTASSVVPEPTNGKVFRYTDDSPTAPFKIVTPAGSDNYFVKLVTWTDHKDVLSIFIKGGSTIQIDVPNGSYEMRYATGQTWYGEDKLFGQNTACYIGDQRLDFSYNSGREVQLIKQIGGNLGTEKVNQNAF
ncbi:MAG: ankyrin repeat domain-containing protein [Ignavibacteriales bacterium]